MWVLEEERLFLTHYRYVRSALSELSLALEVCSYISSGAGLLCENFKRGQYLKWINKIRHCADVNCVLLVLQWILLLTLRIIMWSYMHLRTQQSVMAQNVRSFEDFTYFLIIETFDIMLYKLIWRARTIKLNHVCKLRSLRN